MINGHAPKGETVVKMQNLGGPLGWTVRWEYNETGVAFTCWKIVARQPKGLKLALFVKADAPDGAMTPDAIAAEPYLSGAFKPDGRVLLFGGTVVCHGALGLKFHLGLMKEIWTRANVFLGKDEAALTAEWHHAT